MVEAQASIPDHMIMLTTGPVKINQEQTLCLGGDIPAKLTS